MSGAQGVNLTPDFIARVRWEPAEGHRLHGLLGKTAHVQAAILVRSYGGGDRPAGATLSTGGVGANISGVLVPRWDADDRVKFAVNGGWGIGKYRFRPDSPIGSDPPSWPRTQSASARQALE